jgi:hypothetical protein
MIDEWLNNKELPTPQTQAMLDDIEQEQEERVTGWNDGDIQRLIDLCRWFEQQNAVLLQRLARRN